MSSTKEESFGQWVRVLRESRVPPWNQTDLGSEMGLGQSTISAVEKGERPPTEAFCVALAKAFKLSPNYVLARAGLWEEEIYDAREGPATQKIRALIALLNEDDQERAIRIIETLVTTRKIQPEAKPTRRSAN